MKLNQREVELLSVTRDLFLKGSPEFRVAKYAREQRFTAQQFQHFLDKLNFLDSPTRGRITNHFRDIERGDCFDESVKCGKALDKWLIAIKKIQISDA